MNKNRKYFIILLIFIIIIGIIVGITLIPRSNKEEKEDKLKNQYQISDQTISDNAISYTNDSLKKLHCLDSICIENMTIHYYKDGGGRVDYTILNQSKETVSGVMNINFGKHSLIAYYSDLEPNGTVKTGSYYADFTIHDMSDYTLSSVSDSEKNIIVINK